MAIVLSYHGNRESDAALNEAVRLASWMRTTLVVVLARRVDHEDARTTSDAEERLWKRLGEADIAFSVRHTRVGQEVSTAVLETAEEIDADMIVIGLRPGGSSQTHVGRNASRILLDAHCPVMTASWAPDAS